MMNAYNWTRAMISSIAGHILFATLVVTSLAGCDKTANHRDEKTPTDTVAALKGTDDAATNNDAEKAADAKPAEVSPEEKEEAAPQAIDGDHYSVFSFLTNRPLAHVLQGDMVVADVKYRAFTRNIWGNHARHWKTDLEIDGKKVVALDKRRDGILSVPSPVETPNTLALRLYNPVENAKNDLKVKLNGKALETKSLGKGWNTVVWKLKEQGALENVIELEFTGLGRIDGSLSGGAVAGIEIGNTLAADTKKAGEEKEAGGEQAAVEGPEKGFGLTTGQGAFSMNEHQGAMWYFFNVPGTVVNVSLKGDPGCGASLQIANAKDGKISGAHKYDVKIANGKASAAIKVSGKAGDASRLVLRTLPGCPKVSVEQLDLVAEGKKVVRKTFEPPKHILVWMIDTLRSDYLPIHFKTDVHAPNLKKLAEEGASFPWALVQGNESKTSHASFFTGMYPNRHRVLERGTLKPHMELLPEALQKAGYKTAAYMANGYISKPWGFVQGWDFYRNNLREQLGISAAALRKDTEGWMEKNTDKKFFMYVGTIDPHVSYRAHEGLIEKYVDPAYNGPYKNSCSGEVLGKIKANPEKVSEADRKQIEGLYKNEIEYNDQEFGKLRAFMEEKGMWKDTLVVITADHGDEFWEHGSVGHGHSVYDELVHVPILFYYPPAIDAGVTPESGVDVLDIYPTILDIVGAPPVPDVQGHSLLPLMDTNAKIYPGVGIATRYLSHYAFQVGPWSLLLKRGDFELFNNNDDMNEQHNVATKNPFETRALVDAASWFLYAPKMWEKLTWGTPTNLSKNFLSLIDKQ